LYRATGALLGYSMSTSATVAVIDDDPSVRKAFARLVTAAGMDPKVFASAQEYLEGYDPSIAGCLVLDIAMPGFNGLDLQQSLVAKGGGPPIIFVSGRADVPASVRAMKAGAVEFLTKPVDESTLVAAIKSAIERDRVDRQDRAELAAVRKRLETLTPRECEVLRHVIAGKLNKQSAAALGTVEKTVKVHRARVMEKLQVTSVAALVRLAGRAGINPAG
jgi:FixJ family two-component response regulator